MYFHEPTTAAAALAKQSISVYILFPAIAHTNSDSLPCCFVFWFDGWLWIQLFLLGFESTVESVWFDASCNLPYEMQFSYLYQTIPLQGEWCYENYYKNITLIHTYFTRFPARKYTFSNTARCDWITFQNKTTFSFFLRCESAFGFCLFLADDVLTPRLLVLLLLLMMMLFAVFSSFAMNCTCLSPEI